MLRQFRVAKVLTVMIIIFLLCPVCVHAKHYGPLWAVWTHSEDYNECCIKTGFWFALSAASLVYLLEKAKVEPEERNSPVLLKPWIEYDGKAIISGVALTW